MSKQRRTLFIVLLCLLCLFLLSGCGYKDLDKRYFVVNLGIDHHSGDQKYTLSIKVAIPTKEGQAASSKESTTLSIDTSSLSKGLEILKSRLNKQMDFGHLKVLLVDPYVAEHDMPIITSWFIEQRDIQKIAYIAIAKPDSKTIMNTTPTTEQMPSGTLLLQFGNTGGTSPYTLTEFLFSFYRDLEEKGQTAFLPIIEKKGDRLQIQTVGLFDQNRLVEELSPDKTEILKAFVRGQSRTTWKVVANANQGVASFKTIRTRVKLHASGINPHADISVHAIGDIGIPGETLSQINVLKEQKLMNAKLQKEITALFKELQQKKVDPAGLGLIYRTHHFNHSKEEEKWQAIYPQLTFNVHVQTTFKEAGITG